jgi:hypothetical protein
MRRLILFTLGLALSASVSASTPSTSKVFRPEQKPAGPEYRNPIERIPGDTVSDPFTIGALPFTVTGSTCGFANDYDCACPYTGSTAPDVVYKYVARGEGTEATAVLTVDLCASMYDTKVYIFDGAGGDVIACNDDYCSWQSSVSSVHVAFGHTYYIVVDGYGGSCGTYTMTVTGSPPCILECPAGAMLEGEPTCYDDYDDVYNGGCDVAPFPVFQILEPYGDDPVICGTTGVFEFDTSIYRDSDWFEMDVTVTSFICLNGESEVPTDFLLIDGSGGCSTATIVAYGTAGPCTPVADICHVCDPGTWWAWVGPNTWDTSFACGSVYIMSILGYVQYSVPAASTTWGRVKGMFR